MPALFMLYFAGLRCASSNQRSTAVDRHIVPQGLRTKLGALYCASVFLRAWRVARVMSGSRTI